ncbi:MAG: tetratricopeptide repeat protein [Bacteroidetes bacterium]|nr:tetratricopeptide repeat protein [Bacteroidota bacterium]
MKHLYFFIYIFFLSFSGFAQSDSLKLKALAITVSEEVTHDNLVRISDSLSNVSKIVQREFLFAVNKNAKAKKNQLMEAHSANNLALVYLDFGMYSEAYNLFNQALFIYKKYKRDKGVFNIYSNMGSMYYYMGDIKRSLIYNLKSYQYVKEKFKGAEEASRGSSACINLGSVYGTMGNLALARSYFYKALDYYNRDPDKDSITKAMILNNIGDTYMYSGDNKNALKFFETSSALKLKYGPEEQKADAYNSLGVYWFNQKEYKKAESYLLKTFDHCDSSHPTSDLRKYTQNLSEVYNRLGDYKKENHFLKLTFKTKAFLDSAGKISEIEANEVRSQLRAVAVNDSIQNVAQIKVRDVKLKQKKRESVFGILALIAVSIIAFLFFNRYQLTRRPLTAQGMEFPVPW